MYVFHTSIAYRGQEYLFSPLGIKAGKIVCRHYILSTFNFKVSSKVKLNKLIFLLKKYELAVGKHLKTMELGVSNKTSVQLNNFITDLHKSEFKYDTYISLIYDLFIKFINLTF